MTETATTPEELVLRVLSDPSAIADPYPLYRELRESWPVFHSELTDTWVMTRFEDCRTVLRDPRCGSPEEGDTLPEQRIVQGSASSPRGEAPRTMLFLNPPDHTRIRGLVRKRSRRPAMATRARRSGASERASATAWVATSVAAS